MKNTFYKGFSLVLSLAEPTFILVLFYPTIDLKHIRQQFSS